MIFAVKLIDEGPRGFIVVCLQLKDDFAQVDFGILAWWQGVISPIINLAGMSWGVLIGLG